MPKLTLMINRNPTLSHEEFRAYYEDHHVPLALRYIRPYLLDYRRNYPTGNFSVYGKAESGKSPWIYDCITEMWFASQDSVQAMLATLAQPDVLAIMTEDEARFIDRQSVVILSIDERQTDLDTKV